MVKKPFYQQNGGHLSKDPPDYLGQISNSLPAETFSILLNSYLIFWEVVARCCESASSSPARLL